MFKHKIAAVLTAVILIQSMPPLSWGEDQITRNPPKVEQSSEIAIPTVETSKVSSWVWYAVAVAVAAGGGALALAGGGGGGSTPAPAGGSGGTPAPAGGSTLNVKW
jgi:hypothetical protein